MSGQIIGQLILWLIVAVIVVFIAYWVMNWLYRRSTKETAFVRTGFLGEKVVIDGGAFVWPIIHDITPVNMNTIDLQVKRQREDALITKDRMRVDVDAEFYVRVKQTGEAVSLAASTMGRRMLEPSRIHQLLSGKFISALRTVASEMSMEELHENRNSYVARVLEVAQEGLDKNGLELESVAVTDIDQTEIEFFNPSNRFDAEGLTIVIQEIEARRKLRNDIEQETSIKIRERNLLAEKQALEIERAANRPDWSRSAILNSAGHDNWQNLSASVLSRPQKRNVQHYNQTKKFRPQKSPTNTKLPKPELNLKAIFQDRKSRERKRLKNLRFSPAEK